MIIGEAHFYVDSSNKVEVFMIAKLALHNKTSKRGW